MSKLDAIGLMLHSVCEECYLRVGKMSMGIGKDRSSQRDRDGVAMGGCAWGTNR